MNSVLLKTSLCTAFLFCLSGTIFAQDRTWTPFTPKNGEWTILAPGNLTPDEEAQKPKSSKGSYAYVDFNGFFAVIYRDFSRWQMVSKKGQMSKQRDTVLSASKGSLIRDTEFTSGDISGREVWIRMPDTRVMSRESNIKPRHRVQRFRMFFKGNRLYMLLVVLPEEDINSVVVSNHLNSFKFK